MIRSPRADRVADPRLGAVGRADGVERVEGPARRAAVQRARQRAERGHDRGADVGAGRRHDPRGERRRVEAVVDARGSGTARSRAPRARIGLLAGRACRGSWRAWPRSARGAIGVLPRRSRCSAGDQRRASRRPAAARCGGASAGIGVEVGRHALDRGEHATARCAAPPAGRARPPAMRRQHASRRRRAGAAAAATSAANGRALGRVGSSPSNSRYQTSSNVRPLGELDGRVLAVVVEALEAADVAELGVGDDHALEAAGGTGGGSMVAGVAGMVSECPQRMPLYQR